MRWTIAAAVLFMAAPPAASQAPREPTPRPPVPEDPDCYYFGRCPAVWWGEELAVAGSNVLLGALTAGIWQELAGGSFKDGFSRGALGGALGYAGKRIASGRFPAAGLLGREIAAIGHSVVRNAAERRGTFDRLVLPLSFLPAHLQLGSWGTDARVRVDAIALINLAYGLFEPKLELDWGRSVSWGAAVFMAPGYDFVSDGVQVSAMAGTGTIFLNRDLVGQPQFGRVGAHERVHVLQGDAATIWADAADDWLEARVAPLRWASRYVTPNLFGYGISLVLGWAGSNVDYYHRPWELEAISLAGQDR